MNIKTSIRKLSGPQPLYWDANAAKLGKWHPSTTDIYIPSHYWPYGQSPTVPKAVQCFLQVQTNRGGQDWGINPILESDSELILRVDFLLKISPKPDHPLVALDSVLDSAVDSLDKFNF